MFRKLAPWSGMLIVFMLIACEHPTGFGRDNPNDPVSALFEPDASDAPLTITPDQGAVRLAWQDATDFEDGYVIEKAVGEPAVFEEIADVPEGVQVYRDTSAVGAVTRYRVRPFRWYEGERLLAQEGPTAKLEHGIVDCFYAEGVDGNTISLHWNDQAAYNDGFRIEEGVISRTDTTFIVVDTVETVRGMVGEQSYTYTRDELSFALSLVYRISAYVTHEGRQHVVAQCQLPVDIGTLFAPCCISTEVRDEATIVLRWTNAALFAKGFRLDRPDRPSVYVPIESNTYEDHYLLHTDRVYSYTIYAHDASDPDNVEWFHLSEGARSTLRLDLEPPRLYDGDGDMTEAIHLAWDPHPLAAGYVLQRFETYNDDSLREWTFDATTLHFTDTEVDPDLRYTYYLSTLSSPQSHRRRYRYQRGRWQRE